MLQAEAAECGLAAIAMIANFHGHRIDLASLRLHCGVSLKGMTMADMVRAADRLGLAGRALRLEPREMDQLAAPCVLHWDLNHFVVLAKTGRRGIVIHDPARGRVSLGWADVSRHFTGFALELAPVAGFGAIEAKRSVPWNKALGGAPGLGHAALQIFLMAAVLEVLTLAPPLFSQWMVDGVLFSADRDLLAVLVVGAVLVAVSHAVVSAFRALAVLYVGTALGLRWMNRVFSHLLRLPLGYFERRFIGDVASRFDAVTTIQETLTTQFIEAALNGFMALGTLVLMLVYSPRLALISLAGVSAYALLRFALHRPLKETAEKEMVLDARRDSHFLETLRGIQAIKLFQRQSERRAVWWNLLIEQTAAAVRLEKLHFVHRAGASLVCGLERAAILWAGATLVLDSSFSVGMYMAFIAFSAQFSENVAGLIDKAALFALLRLSGERLSDIVLTEPEPEPLRSLAVPRDGSLEFREVAFRYAESEPWVCRDLSFTVREGESVALVGPSGSGKTTILKLVLGFFAPEQGEILIGGVPMRQLGVHGARAWCAAVMQDDQLFAGSLLDNIAFFDPCPDLARVELCATMAAIHDTIRAMPMGYHTLAGDMGTTLSGGQRQRVLLARALYKAPRILLLDEATSHLDLALEAQVSRAVAQLSLTRVIVAHRPETIRSADRVIDISRKANARAEQAI